MAVGQVARVYVCVALLAIVCIVVSSYCLVSNYGGHHLVLTSRLIHHEVRVNFENGSTQSSDLNPGCIHKKFGLYKPIDTGRVYHHPAVIHYAKLSNEDNPVKLAFLDYMAAMSAYKFLKPERMLFHTYTDIEGKYWHLIKEWKHTSAEVIKVKRVTHIGGKEVQFIANQADYIKLQGLLKFGGVMSDFDVIVINGTRYKQMQRISECVLSRGGKTGEFVNPGFTSCVRNSSFVRKWLEEYHRDYKPELYVYNASLKPLMILEDSASDACYNVHLDGTICLDPNPTQQKERWKKRNGVQWRGKTAAHHFLKSGDQRLLQKRKSTDTSFSDMLRFVYYA